MSNQQDGPKAPPEPFKIPASELKAGRVISVGEGRGYVTGVATRKGPSGQDALVVVKYVANDLSYTSSHLANEEIEVLL